MGQPAYGWDRAMMETMVRGIVDQILDEGGAVDAHVIDEGPFDDEFGEIGHRIRISSADVDEPDAWIEIRMGRIDPTE